MAREEEIVVLACSKKWGGRCVAGISTDSGGWVRPVSNAKHGQLSPIHYRIDGRDTDLLDIVRFDHRGDVGDPSQPENVELADAPWRLTGRLESNDAYRRLSGHIVRGSVLLGNRGKAIPVKEAERGVAASLALIEPTNVRFVLEQPYEETGPARPRVAFRLGRRSYDLALTDFRVRPRLFDAGYGSHAPADLELSPDDRLLLTVSLAEARDEWCNKLVAAVLQLPDA